MATTSIPTHGTEAEPANTEGAPPPEEKKDDTAPHAEHPHHAHHHEPRIIHPASAGTTHLDPGAISIKP